jgi:hypothetical protein
VCTRSRQIASPFGPKWHAVRTDFHKKSLNWSVLVFIRTSVIKSHRYIQVGFAQKKLSEPVQNSESEIHTLSGKETCRWNEMGILPALLWWAYRVRCCVGHTACVTVMGIPCALFWWAYRMHFCYWRKMCITVMGILCVISVTGILRALLWIRKLIATRLNLDERTGDFD